jgi:hypothetical protein
MAAGAVVRHITWDLRQSRMCAQLCSARGLQYVTGLSDLSTEGARRQLQVMQREYPSIQQLHVVLDETLPQQLLDDLPGLIAAYVSFWTGYFDQPGKQHLAATTTAAAVVSAGFPMQHAHSCV